MVCPARDPYRHRRPKGLVILQPNESLVCLLFGSYVGTEHRPGLWWVNPLNSKNKISRRLETLESGPLKVNDAVGKPVDIGAVVVWRVEDAARALLEVGSYANYAKAQSETALRRMASVHPYDEVEAEEAVEQGERPAVGTHRPDGGHMPMSTVTLRDGGDAIIETLPKEIRTRMEPIGVSVVEGLIDARREGPQRRRRRYKKSVGSLASHDRERPFEVVDRLHGCH